MMEHPHTRHRNMVWEKDGYRNVGNPVKLSRTPPSVRSKPRKYGIDTRAVLAEHGFSDGRDRQADRLRRGAHRDPESLSLLKRCCFRKKR